MAAADYEPGKKLQLLFQKAFLKQGKSNPLSLQVS